DAEDGQARSRARATGQVVGEDREAGTPVCEAGTAHEEQPAVVRPERGAVVRAEVRLGRDPSREADRQRHVAPVQALVAVLRVGVAREQLGGRRVGGGGRRPRRGGENESHDPPGQAHRDQPKMPGPGPGVYPGNSDEPSMPSWARASSAKTSRKSVVTATSRSW